MPTTGSNNARPTLMKVTIGEKKRLAQAGNEPPPDALREAVAVVLFDMESANRQQHGVAPFTSETARNIFPASWLGDIANSDKHVSKLVDLANWLGVEKPTVSAR